MLFNSIPFLVFFPLFCLFFFGTRGRARRVVMLAGSYLFYGWWDWRFCFLLLASTLLDFGLARLIERANSPAGARRLLAVSVAANLGFLGAFKYFNFFSASLERAAAFVHWSPSRVQLHVLLPVGISFYTFQSLSYTIDVYRKELAAEKGLLRYAVFVAFFPQLVAGPIVRARDMLPQLRRETRFDYERMMSGLGLVLWGLFKKVAVADSLGNVVDPLFARPGVVSGAALLVGVVFYAFQIYCDFSGYSDIAIGVARVLGYHLPRNFHRPYVARSFSEFWQRWHVTLSSWFRDYLYIPMGGGRKGAPRTAGNLLLTMSLVGLWHGASWTFVCWGLLHGLYLVGQRLVERPGGWLVARARPGARLVGPPAAVCVFGLTCLAWVFFRSPRMSDAFELLRAPGRGFSLKSIPNSLLVAKGAVLIAGLWLAEAVNERVPLSAALGRRPVARCFAFSALLWGIALFGTFSGARFIYFQF